MKILYVEDEKHLALAVAQVLKKHHYSVDLAHDGITGLNLALSGLYDLIILDIMLPKQDGLSVLQQLRHRGNTSPVILLTAKGTIEDKVQGLDTGADDYLTKPFQTEELLARLRALSRRNEQLSPNHILNYGDITLNYNTLDLTSDNHQFHLTLKESQLLELLIRNKGIAISANTIIEKLWGWDSDADDSHVQVQIAFLRKKLSLLSQTVRIKTIRGVGYLLTFHPGGNADV